MLTFSFLGAVTMKRLFIISVLTAMLAFPAEAVEIKKDGWLFPNPALAEKLKILEPGIHAAFRAVKPK